MDRLSSAHLVRPPKLALNKAGLHERLRATTLPAGVAGALRDDIDRVEDSNAVELARLERAVGLPWASSARAGLDLADLQAALERNLPLPAPTRERIVEFLAVWDGRTRHPNPAAGAAQTLLCLTGPRGVGKSAVARGIASALGRPLQNIDLARLWSDEDFFGRDTAPGALMRAFEAAGATDVVIVLDGVDAFGERWRSDPYAVVQAVTDPARRAAFRDPFYRVPFDFSSALVIATAPWVHGLPGWVRDRLDLVELEGYAAAEKLHIATQSVLPSILAEWGVEPATLQIADAALLALIRNYTADAGLRELERLLRAIVRQALVRVRLGGAPPLAIAPENLPEYVGRPPALLRGPRPNPRPGVVGALVVGRLGGEFELIEASNMPGNGRLTFSSPHGTDTSMRLAVVSSYVRSRMSELAVSARVVEEFDTHMQVPVGALPGDEGAIAVPATIALISLLRDQVVDPELGVTGGMSLHGRVLGCDGLRHKMLAAHRAGIKRVLLPRVNERELDDLPPQLHDEMTFIPVDEIAQALTVAFR